MSGWRCDADFSGVIRSEVLAAGDPAVLSALPQRAVRYSGSRSNMADEILCTARLRLRAYTPADQAALFEVFADAYARRFYPEMADPARVKAWIEWNLRNYDEFGFGLWAMELKAGGQLLGDCGLTYQDSEGRNELEIGYHVIQRERGKGYATEAARECLNFGFTRTSAENICSIVRPSNNASCAVAARIHTTRREFMKGGQPALLFYTLRRDWETLRKQR